MYIISGIFFPKKGICFFFQRSAFSIFLAFLNQSSIFIKVIGFNDAIIYINKYTGILFFAFYSPFFIVFKLRFLLIF
jgi:hypothetical protein